MFTFVSVVPVGKLSGGSPDPLRTPELAKAAVQEDPKVVMNELAKAPEVAQIVAATNVIAAAVPSTKVVGPAPAAWK